MSASPVPAAAVVSSAARANHGLLAPPGAERLYLPADDWQNHVRDLLVRARLVLIVLDATPGTVWEFVEATRCVSPERLVLLVVDEEEYRLFRKQAAVLLKSTAEQVRRDGGGQWSPPQFPEYRRTLLRPSAVRRENGNYGRLFDGLITYSSDWRANYAPLSTALGSQDARLLRHDMAPVLARLFAFEARRQGIVRPDQPRRVTAIVHPPWV